MHGAPERSQLDVHAAKDHGKVSTASYGAAESVSYHRIFYRIFIVCISFMSAVSVALYCAVLYCV